VTVPTFNLADLFEIVADAVPDRLALVAGDRRLTYAELDERSTRLGRHLLGSGLAPGDHVAVVAWNRAEWLESMLGAYKARLVPINLNYRYTAGELRHVLADAGCRAAIVEHGLLAPLTTIVGELPDLHHVIGLDDGEPLPTLPTGMAVVPYDDALAAAPADRDHPAFRERSPDDRYVLYTGGTTGSPKGVVWRAEDIYFAALGGTTPERPRPERPEDLATRIVEGRVTGSAEVRPWLVTSPMMHGNGQWNSLRPLYDGLGVVLWTGHRFDAAAVADLAERERAHLLVLVGDGMSLPFVDAVEAADAAGRPFDLSTVRVIASGGAILSPVVKQRLTAVLPQAIIVDGFGASETGSNGRLLGAPGDGPPRFSMGPETIVVDDDLRPVVAGRGEVGRLARRGHVPLGYWNDPAKTAATFPVDADGTRWAIPGDLAVPEADGTITLLGRGSACINTGGEKVHPEEVAAAVKSHPGVADAIVVGAPDERFGQRVVAVVTARPGAGPAPDLTGVRAHLADRLAGYKAPRQLVVVDELAYTAQGKPDLRWAADLAAGLAADVAADPADADPADLAPGAPASPGSPPSSSPPDTGSTAEVGS
jgi:fatty-acyl-CoA synthase